MKLLLHTCCAPCSVYCIEELKKENIDITSFWYNPNIHPYKEYEARLETLKNYDKKIGIPLIIEDYYGLREFCKNVTDKLDNRCGYCYLCRLDKTACYAKENGYDVEELNTKEIVVAKKLYSTDGAILSDIYNVANQVNCLNGTYEGYKID